MTKLAALTPLLLWSAIAHADPKSEARPHIDAATKAHAAGEFATALAELQAAYAIDPEPDLLYAIGQVEAKLGQCTEATSFYERFRATQRDPAVGKVIDQAIAACQPRAAAAVEPPPRVEPPPPPEPAARAPFYTDVIGDALVAGGVVAEVVAIVFYSKARSDLDSAEAATTLTGYDGLVDDAHGARTTAVIFAAAGGALVIGGIVKYVLRGDARESSAVGLVPAAGGGLVTWGARF